MTESLVPTQESSTPERKPWREPELVVVDVVERTGNAGTGPADDSYGS